MVDIVGYLRFSHPARSDLGIQRQLKHDELIESIWSPEKMETRFFCFETFTLPSIRAQTDGAFRICVLASPKMPGNYLRRLESATKGIEQITLQITDAGPDETAHDLFENWYRANHNPKPGKTLHFRLDDDDAFSKNMIRNMRARAPRMKPGEALSCPNGLLAGMYQGQPTVASMHKPFHSICLAFMRDRHDFRCSPYRGPSHSRTGFNRAAHLDPLSPAWIYMYHKAADTVRSHEKRFDKSLSSGFAIRVEDQLAHLEEEYPFLTEASLRDAISRIP